MLGKVPGLPLTFPGNACGPGGGSGDGVVGGTGGMGGNVGGCGGMARGARRRPGGGMKGIAGSGMGGHCGGTSLVHRHLIMRPGPPRFNRSSRTVIFGIFLLEIWQHMLGAVSGPKRQ